LAISNVFNNCNFINGPEVTELENRLRKYTGAKYCISCSSGTDALLIALMAIGIKQGDEVITSPFTFASTVETIFLLGAKPIYADINIDDFNINPDLIEDLISPKTKAIVPVSLFGQCANMKLINEIGKKYNIPVIEDGAQSFGATYHGKKSCALTDIGCTSFFPSKPLGCYGDGGAIFTSSSELNELMKSIRSHGQEKRYQHTRIGINGRLDTIQAAILLQKMEIFDDEIERRINVANYYSENLSSKYIVPKEFENTQSVYAQYSILSSDRNQTIKRLEDCKIPFAIHYPKVAYKQKAFLDCNFECGVAEDVSNRILSLPMHPYMKKSQQNIILDCLNN